VLLPTGVRGCISSAIIAMSWGFVARISVTRRSFKFVHVLNRASDRLQSSHSHVHNVALDIIGAPLRRAMRAVLAQV
jgi:hypothetical protein